MKKYLQIKTALLSVSNKKGLHLLAESLHRSGVELISTRGTGKYLEGLGIPCTPVEKISRNPEILDGRVKTLSYTIEAAILYDRGKPSHRRQVVEHNIPKIDLIVCNLYPFEEAAAKNLHDGELIEYIDIGGPTMLRSAAKNFHYVCVLTSPEQYEGFITEFNFSPERSKSISFESRRAFAMAAFQLSAAYDTAIIEEMNKRWSETTERNNQEHYKPRLKTLFTELEAIEEKPLRYGENPHQDAFVLKRSKFNGLAAASPMQGKAMSYNNLLDADAALASVLDLHKSAVDRAVAVVVKHLNPCGSAIAKSQCEAIKLAWDGDPISAFGSILAFNQILTRETAEFISDKFVELIIAPEYDPEALAILAGKKNLRVIAIPIIPDPLSYTARSIHGGVLVQEKDSELDCNYHLVTKKPFDNDDKDLISFGIILCKHLKSNAIALVIRQEESCFLIGSGMGNPNRILSLEQSVQKARQNGCTEIENAILVSDAFFPFRDSIDLAHNLNIKKLVQPGGSIRDEEIIAACDEYGMSMLFTGQRHFSH